MRKILLLLILGIFMVSFISADIFEIDNVKDYDEQTKTITVKNSIFGIKYFSLDTVAEIKLTSNLVQKVPLGYGKVAQFEITMGKDYINSFKEMEFYDIRNNGERFERDFDYKYLVEETETVQDYERVCSDNKTCQKVNVGSHEITRDVWYDLSSSDFVDGGILTIGIFTDVKEDDYIEWIPNFFGVRISEWAVWTASLDVGLLTWYKLDTSSGVVLDSVTTGVFNATNVGSTRGITGRINNSFNLTRASGDHIFVDSNFSIGDYPFSFSGWFNTNFTLSSGEMSLFGLSSRTAGATNYVVNVNTANNLFILARDGGSTDASASANTINNGAWRHVVGVFNTSTDRQLWLDGVSILNQTASITYNDDDIQFIIGAQNNSIGNFFDGGVDEIGVWNRSLSMAEVIQLYNNGNGITITGIPTIELNAPINNSNLSNANVIFNASVELLVQSGPLISNVSLFIDNVLNETNTSGVTGIYLFDKNLSDGVHTWFISVVNTDTMNPITINSSENTFNVDTLNPIIVIEAPTGVLNINSIGFPETLNVTITDINLDECWFDYNGTNVTIEGCLSGIKNSTTFILEDGNFNLTVYANDTFGKESSSFTSWVYKIFETSRTFSNDTIETASETFIINITANSSLTAVQLSYDGTLRSTTLGSNASTVTFDIPIGVGNKSLFWSFTYAGTSINSTTSGQNVAGLVFNLCNATLTTSYINISFRNESTNNESISAIIDSTWNFAVGSGSINKQITVANSTQNVFYNFCSSASNDTLITNLSIAYNNNLSQQRVFTSEPILTNVTTQITLYLLQSTLGLFTQFQTRDVSNNPISLVKGVISRTLSGQTITVASSLTDSSGLVIFFLNPDITYNALFSKTGLTNNAFTFFPTTDLRFVTMGTGVTVNGSNVSLGTNSVITPSNSSLSNGTLVTFGFNVTGNSGITLISMNLTNQDGDVLSFQSNAGVGFISAIVNTSNNSKIIGRYIIQTGEETLIFSKVWTVGNEFVGDYSIFRQGTLFLDYGFSDFIRLFLVLAILFGVMIYMSSNQLADNTESKVAVIIGLIWIFSIIGWLDNPAIVSDIGIAQFGKQYGIAILSSVAGFVFFMRRSIL